nr:DUF6792 domain-containing protein [Oceanobacillus sp. CFH 90083]
MKSATIKDSGYDGTALKIKKGNKEEIYVISQGSKDNKDWEYNLSGLFAGQVADQAYATAEFEREALNHFNVADEINTIGLSHSLAHNNNTTAHLLFDTFDEVFSVNGTQTNYYQLFNSDIDFEEKVTEEFSIGTKYNSIYDIPPEELHAFAVDFYSDKSENITQYGFNE